MKADLVNPIPPSSRTPSDLWSACTAITESAPFPMASVQGERHIVRSVNPAFCRLMDKSSEELLGEPLGGTTREKAECGLLIDRVYLTGKSESHTEREVSRTPSVFWSYTMWPLVADHHPVGVMLEVTETAKFHEQTVALNEALLLGTLRQDELIEAANVANDQLQEEILERKLVEEELRLAQETLKDRAAELENRVVERTAELTAINKQLEAFVYTIAHDLRAPLRAMQGYSSMLVDEESAGLSETGRGYADRINKSAQFMDALLIDLLAFSRISQERIILTPVSLKAVIDTVLFRLQDDVVEKKGQIESVGPWPDVLGHEPTLAQVLFNLLGNALKFVAPGVRPRIRLWTEGEGELVRVYIKDNGVGIAPDDQREIFRLFTRLEGERYPGTGIGLAIVQKGVERMGGRNGVTSSSGQGSIFWIELRKSQNI